MPINVFVSATTVETPKEARMLIKALVTIYSFTIYLKRVMRNPTVKNIKRIKT